MKNAPKLTLPALFTHTRLIKPKGKLSTSCPENSTSLNSSFLKCSPKNQATFAALQHRSDPTIPLGTSASLCLFKPTLLIPPGIRRRVSLENTRLVYF